MTSLLRAASIVPAPALLQRARAFLHHSPRFIQKARGPERRYGASGLPFASLSRGGRFAALQHGDFSAWAALFVRRKSLSVSELLAPARSGRRRGPMPSRERGSEPRPRAPVPIPAKHACRTAPRGSGRAHPKAARRAGDKESQKIFSIEII